MWNSGCGRSSRLINWLLLIVVIDYTSSAAQCFCDFKCLNAYVLSKISCQKVNIVENLCQSEPNQFHEYCMISCEYKVLYKVCIRYISYYDKNKIFHM